MNGRKTVLGALALAVVTQPVFGELRTLDDQALSGVLGQAGISIEIEAQLDIGEIAFKDQGYILVRDLELGGIGGTALDNILMTIDVAGDSEVLHRGFSRMAEWADQGLVSAANADVADAVAKYDQGGGQFGEAFNDGDLVIHLDATDPGVLASNSSDQNLAAYTSATDFELTVGSVEFADSGYAPGSSSTSGGSMFSDISIQGYLGPTDIIIRNGTGAYTDNQYGGLSLSDAKVEIDANFRVTDLDMNWDNGDLLVLFNLANLKLRDMQIHNTRGNDAVGRFGFASVSATISEGISHSTGTTGLAVTDIDLRMDIDMPHVQFGDAPSIGKVYFTDFVITSDLLVYGH